MLNDEIDLIQSDLIRLKMEFDHIQSSSQPQDAPKVGVVEKVNSPAQKRTLLKDSPSFLYKQGLITYNTAKAMIREDLTLDAVFNLGTIEFKKLKGIGYPAVKKLYKTFKQLGKEWS